MAGTKKASSSLVWVSPPQAMSERDEANNIESFEG
jgi:hypothetical protein